MGGRPWVEPLTLEGTVVRLEPLSMEHVPGLTAVGLDAELWRWTLNTIQTPGDMRAYVEMAIAAAVAGTEVPYATVELETGKVVGSTRFLSIEPHHRRLEIGYTWIAPPWQRSAVNTDAKLLMLSHAFEALGLERVELKTDRLNDASRRAILRLGATEEGTLRSHMLCASGRRRDSVYYSILRAEWPAAKQRLERRSSS